MEHLSNMNEEFEEINQHQKVKGDEEEMISTKFFKPRVLEMYWVHSMKRYVLEERTQDLVGQYHQRQS